MSSERGRARRRGAVYRHWSGCRRLTQYPQGVAPLHFIFRNLQMSQALATRWRSDLVSIFWGFIEEERMKERKKF